MKRFLFTLVLLLPACAVLEKPFIPSGETGASQLLFDPENPVQDWLHQRFPRQERDTEYRVVSHEGKISIRAVGTHSASALYRRIDVDPKECPFLEWEWRVEILQEGANLHKKETDDVAASVSLIFGDPGFLSSLIFKPTIRYVWTNNGAKVNEVIKNPYLGIVRNIVVRSGTAKTGVWMKERRNLIDDFRRAFGEHPTEGVERLVLFTDNDNTKEPVEAYYGKIFSMCSSEKLTAR